MLQHLPGRTTDGSSGEIFAAPLTPAAASGITKTQARFASSSPDRPSGQRRFSFGRQEERARATNMANNAGTILSRIKDEEIDWVDLRFTDPKGKWQHLT